MDYVSTKKSNRTQFPPKYNHQLIFYEIMSLPTLKVMDGTGFSIDTGMTGIFKSKHDNKLYHITVERYVG